MILRTGMRPDGRTLVLMPSASLSEMSDEELGDIVAFMRSRPRFDGPGPSVALGPMGRVLMATGRFRTAVQAVAAAGELPAATNAEAKTGRYLARGICTECHGSVLGGKKIPFDSPSLQVVRGYTPDGFARLMKTGIAPGERTVGVMTGVARRHLSAMTDAEVAALYAYLHAFDAGNGE